jgi:lysophospholipase L1-like esterase
MGLASVCGRGIAAGLLLMCAAANARADALGEGPPCRGASPPAPLPALQRALSEDRAVKIVAIGSSSTEGVGARNPANAYPARLEADLRARFPGRAIEVVNRGVGGEDVVEMLARFERDVVAEKPDLVIWQVASNAMMRGVAAESVGAAVSRGIARIREIGADAMLMTPQFAPRINGVERRERMLSLLAALAQVEGVATFPRYEIMRDWREKDGLPFSAFLTEDGLHLNDWAYACTARLLASGVAEQLSAARLRTAGTR